MACAKHFPGHGDVAVDSHYDLPVINKSMTDLDSLEMYPFRQIFKEGVGSVMIAHLLFHLSIKEKTAYFIIGQQYQRTDAQQNQLQGTNDNGWTRNAGCKKILS